ncbi:MAG: metallophosphoesterase [Lachnospiraceae bacterium]|nr:metallophosphoesterase [Lachnospiraceae bacterium]
MKSKKKTIIIAICVLMIALFCFWQNNVLEVTHYTFSSSRVSARLDGYRIVQISDLHNKNFGRKQQHLINKIKELQPDMIVVTGDIVDSNHTNIDVAITFLEEAVNLAPCYYITGNHELWLDDTLYEKLINQIKNTGTTILDNEVVEINHNEKDDTVEDTTDFVMIGLDDGSLLGNTLHELSKDINTQKFVLLLAHEPQNMSFYSKENVDLILSGHAHGGQFRLPGIGGMIAPDQGLFPEYTEGLHVKNDVSMIISRGLGNSIIPLRILNRPEIVCVELEHE